MKRLWMLMMIVSVIGGCETINYVRDRIPPPQQTDDGVLFRYDAPSANSVHIAGDFNNWADNKSGVVTDDRWALRDDDGDGIWEITLQIAPGRYLYKFVVDHDQWYTDPNAVEQDSDSGNSVLIIY